MSTWRQELRAQMRLAVPVVVVQLGLMAMGAVDGAFLGRVDAVQYAAVSIGHSWTFFFLAIGMGCLNVLDPVVSQAHGAGDERAVGRGVQRGIVLAFAFSIVVTALVWPADRALTLLRQDPAVIPVATDYVRVSAASFAPFLVFVALRQALQALHLLRALVVVILAANLLNAFLDWVLIRGNLGFPAMGAVGAAWATVAMRWAMVFALPLLAGRDFQRYLWPLAPRVLAPRAIGRMLRVGLPVGVQWGVEVGAFATIAVLMGTLGAEELAGHQVAITLASAAFMVPLGMSMASAVRVGTEIGRGDAAAVRRAAKVGLACAVAVMLVFGALFLSVPQPLARILTDLPDVLALAVALLPLAGLFQIFDGTQVVAVGILRGMADTRVPMLFHVLGFWALGIPVGAGLAFGADLGGVGLWWGLVAGLAAVACAQFLRLRSQLRKEFVRLVVDRDEDEPAPERAGARRARFRRSLS